MIPNKTFYLVSDSAHFFFALSVLLLSGSKISWVLFFSLVLFAAAKEAIWDVIFEKPEVRGSGLRDFLGYLLGAITGAVILYYRNL